MQYYYSVHARECPVSQTNIDVRIETEEALFLVYILNK